MKKVLEPSDALLPMGKTEFGDSGGRALPGIPSGDDKDDTPDVRRSDVDTFRNTPLTLLRPLAALASLRIASHWSPAAEDSTTHAQNAPPRNVRQNDTRNCRGKICKICAGVGKPPERAAGLRVVQTEPR